MASTFEKACARTAERLEEVARVQPGIPSVVVGLVKCSRTRIIASGSGGTARPADGRTLYALASCLKPMTAMVLLDTLRAGGDALGCLERRLRDLPGLDQMVDSNEGAAPTVQDLLAHRGYPDTSAEEPGASSSLTTRTCQLLADTPLPALPRINTAEPIPFFRNLGYRNDNYWLAGWLVANSQPPPQGGTRTWAGYEEAMRRRLWGPLKMRDTCCRPTSEQLSRGACPMQYVVLAGTSRATRVVPTDIIRFGGVSMGEGYACGQDLLAFLRVAANEKHWTATGTAPGELKGLLDLFRAARQFPYAEADHERGSEFGRMHGTGWTAHSDAGRAGEIWFRGDKLGYQALLAADPDRRSAVCVLSNVWAHTPEEAAQAGTDPRTTFNRSARILQQLAERAMNLLRGVPPGTNEDDELLTWRDAPPVIATEAAAQYEREFVFETETPDTFVRVRRDRVRRVVWAGEKSPGWQDRLVGALDLPAEVVARPFHDARPRGFEPASSAHAAPMGTWHGALARPWWWSRLSVRWGAVGQGDSEVRIGAQPPLSLRNVLAGRAPLRPYASTGPLPLVHAEVLVPDGGGYGLIDLLRVEEGAQTALLGDWIQGGQTYHAALWRAPGPSSVWRWPALLPGRWEGHLLTQDGPRPLVAMDVAAQGVGRRRRATLHVAELGAVRLHRFVGLNGALRFYALGPAGPRIYGWGAFFGATALGTLVLPHGARRFLMRHVGSQS